MKKGDPIYLYCPRCKGRVLVVEGVTPMCPGCASTDLVRPGSPMPERIVPRKIFWSLMAVGLGVAVWFYVGKFKGPKPDKPKTDAEAVQEGPVEPSNPVKEPAVVVEVEPELPGGKSEAPAPPPKVITPVQPQVSSGAPATSREDEADPREVARLHRMVAVAAAEMEANRRTMADQFKQSSMMDNFHWATVLADPAGTEKAFRTGWQSAQERQKTSESLASALRTEIRGAAVGEPARTRGMGYFHAVDSSETEIWTELASVLRDATTEVPVLAVLMRRAGARDAEGGLVFRNPADQATWKERLEAFSLLGRRWQAVQGRLREPATLPPVPAIPVSKDGDLPP